MQMNQLGQISQEYYTTSKAAKVCGVSSSTIYRAIQNKQLKAFTTPGGHFRISRTELEQFVKSIGMTMTVAESSRATILLIEDNPVELRLMKRILDKDTSFEVKAVVSGFKAGFLIQSIKPDVIILDIYLKDRDGREIINLVRADPQLKKIKIVVVTGIKDSKEIAEIKNSAIDYFISKPVNPKTFVEQVKSVL